MLKIAIADDENIVRMGLQAFIDWESYGFELVGLFNNGKEVMEYCMNSRIDILLTDIKMPVMDGIELIRKIRKLIPDISIVVLSNYDDFNLVSDSYKEGVYDYVLKQFIQPQSLLKVLNSIKDSKNKKETSEDLSHLSKELRERKINLLHSLLFSETCYDNGLLKEIEAVHVSIRPENMFCMLLQLYGKDRNGAAAYKNINNLSSNICMVVLETVSKYCSAECLPLDRNSIALVVSFPPDYGRQMTLDRVRDIMKDINETIASIFNMDAVLGCSENHRSFSELSCAYNEALEAVDHYFFKSSQKCFFHKSKKNYRETAFEENKIKKNIFAALKCKDYNLLQNTVSALFETACRELVLSAAEFKRLVLEIVCEIDFFIVEAYNKSVQEFSINKSKTVTQYILDCTDAGTLYEYISSIIATLPAPGSHSENVPVIKEIKAYILKNYMDNIRLSDLSVHFGISSSYLCRLFKEKTGENLSCYISRIRIEESMELMEKTSLTSDEIAERIGYPNTNYFIKVFKKITGKTVSEFKSRKFT